MPLYILGTFSIIPANKLTFTSLLLSSTDPVPGALTRPPVPSSRPNIKSSASANNKSVTQNQERATTLGKQIDTISKLSGNQGSNQRTVSVPSSQPVSGQSQAQQTVQEMLKNMSNTHTTGNNLPPPPKSKPNLKNSASTSTQPVAAPPTQKKGNVFSKIWRFFASLIPGKRSTS